MTAQDTSPSGKQIAALFSGSLLQTIVFLIALALIDAFTIWFVSGLIDQEDWILAIFVCVVTVGINAAFLIDGLYPFRWFSPGIALLIIMIIYPTVFTLYVAFTNYADGNLLTKDQARDILASRLYLPEDGTIYSYIDSRSIPAIFRSTEHPDEYGIWLMPVSESDTETPPESRFVTRNDTLLASEIDFGPFVLNRDGIPTGLPGWERLPTNRVLAVAQNLQSSEVMFGAEQNITFNPLQLNRQMGEFVPRYTFGNDDTLYDEKWGVLYKAIEGTYTPIEGPYMDANGHVAVNVEIMEPLTRYTLTDTNDLIDNDSGVTYTLQNGEFIPSDGPFRTPSGDVAIDGTLAEPLTQYELRDDGTLLDTDTDVVYALEDSTYVPVDGPVHSTDGEVAFGGDVAQPLEGYTFADGQLTDTETSVVFEYSDGAFRPVSGPFTDAEGHIAVDGEIVEPLANYTFADGQLTDTETQIVYEAVEGVFAPVDGPFKNEDGAVLVEEGGDVATPLNNFTFNAENNQLTEDSTGVVYEPNDAGEFIPVEGPFTDAEGHVAVDAELVEPLESLSYDASAGTITDATTGVVYEPVDGVLTPVDSPFRDAENNLIAGAELAEPLDAYEATAEGRLRDVQTQVVYEPVEGTYTPVEGPYLNQEGAIAYNAQLVPPLTRFTLNDDGTLLDNQTDVLYERDVDGVLQPIDGPFKDADGNVLNAEVLPVLRPGYFVTIGFENFQRLVKNDRIRGPFLRVFVWTVAHAFFTVFLTFWYGLFLAIILNADFMPGRGVLRTMLLVPYAIPAFISVLVWRGLLNDQLGVVNKAIEAVLGVDGPNWRTDANWVKVAILLIQLWLGFPYMMLITTGALQSIPRDIYEAARVDGASIYQQFRHLTLPLLLVAIGPLLIASFAFNFNNFTIVELFAEGGPPIAPDTPAGHSDILITYTYSLAFGSGRGADYGFASTISIVIFVMVAIITYFNFQFTQRWEETSENV